MRPSAIRTEPLRAGAPVPSTMLIFDMTAVGAFGGAAANADVHVIASSRGSSLFIPASRSRRRQKYHLKPYSINRISLARAIAPVLVLTSSLANTFFKCHFAVERAMRER